jgi:electron transfer flavoprotein alpha subunit
VILVLVDDDPIALEALTFARRLGTVEALAFDDIVLDGLASRVRRVRLDAYAPAAWAQTIVELAPETVVAAGTDRGHEVLAHVAALLDAPLAANCVDARVEGDVFHLTRQRWGGSLLEEARLSGTPKLLTVAPHAVVAEAVEGAPPPVVEDFAPGSVSDEPFVVRVARREEPQADGARLDQARVVVGGGRGVGSAEGFAVLEELAALLGGAVGGSRVVTNLGWRPHSDQVGQTGARIAPDVYIACGVSGAIQHWVGCKAAKKILAINTDRDAPLVAKADYAVIGDLHEIVPAIIAELRKP